MTVQEADDRERRLGVQIQRRESCWRVLLQDIGGQLVRRIAAGLYTIDAKDVCSSTDECLTVLDDEHSHSI